MQSLERVIAEGISEYDSLCPRLIGQQQITVDVVAGTAFALLVALASTTAEPRDELPDALASSLDEIGDRAGETWLNLLGVALDAGLPYTAEHLLETLEEIDPVELRRHLLGRYAWSWCALAGVADIEAAAVGDGHVATRLLEHPRYYAGRAAESLGTLLPLAPAETRARIVRAVEEARNVLVGGGTDLTLKATERAARARLDEETPLAAIERLTTGYRYVPEPEAERVVLVPHLDRHVSLVLAQHRSARLIVYRARPEPGGEARLLALGRALADPKRIELLALVAHGTDRVSELVAASGLSRSTVHYHLTQLREAGLVGLEGNARAYRYVARRDAAAAAAELIDDVIGRNEEE